MKEQIKKSFWCEECGEYKVLGYCPEHGSKKKRLKALNKKQKEILKSWLEKELKGKENESSLTIYFSVEKDLPTEIYNKVKDLNDFETINQEIENYIIDLLN